jgi:hypothetical protein
VTQCHKPVTVSRRANPGYTYGMRVALIVMAFLSLASVLVYIGLLLWAAREDGRDQRRRDARKL